MSVLSYARVKAVLLKEFVQMRRDRMTFAMMIGVPIMQLILFGFAINSDPRHLPTALIDRDQSAMSRSIIKAAENSTFMNITEHPKTDEDAENLIREGKVNFILMIPENFARDLVRGERPQVLLVADATDPSASSGAVNSMREIVSLGLRRDLQGALSDLADKPPAVDVVLHKRYNPAGITQYNIIPGLLGIIIAMTMTMITAVAITREKERGTMENLLAMPIKPMEMMIGKVAPYVIIGYIQTLIVLLASEFIFDIPMSGNFSTLFMAVTLYIIVNLMIGFFFSSVAETQMQALQMTFFMLLPQILLSGFLFPFLGMPRWAQMIGQCLPATHFMRLMRGIMLKGAGSADLFASFWPLLVIMVVVGIFAMLRYKQTLD
ncbi:MAG: ABC transporter permease [Alphaproteobacteria bacterium]|nr:ABC transporter permease [Alphaproteobacteria bacterium]HPF46915.1 ABC transporter permease [Emcibacteraceae bacterium]HRW28865.1 ABC transporter permease [Emcibacteraceae bacterium]